MPFVGGKTVKLLVNGDSMELDFSDGGVIEYHHQPNLENSEIIVFTVNSRVTMKKFEK